MCRLIGFNGNRSTVYGADLSTRKPPLHPPMHAQRTHNTHTFELALNGHERRTRAWRLQSRSSWPRGAQQGYVRSACVTAYPMRPRLCVMCVCMFMRMCHTRTGDLIQNTNCFGIGRGRADAVRMHQIDRITHTNCTLTHAHTHAHGGISYAHACTRTRTHERAHPYIHPCCVRTLCGVRD